MEFDFLKMAQDIKDELIEIRRDFHMHPELDYDVFRTQGKIKEFLKNEIGRIFKDPQKQEAILGNLYHETRDERFEIMMKKLKAILGEH